MKENIYAYELGGVLYLNVTNRCSNKCAFCIRDLERGIPGYNLWLAQEPDLSALLKAAGDVRSYGEVVFCGYGEPLYRPRLVIQAARELKQQGVAIRINTNGQGDLLNGYPLAPLLAGVVDTVSISLNAPDAQQYVALCRPIFGEKAFWAMLDFAKSCKEHLPQVIFSVVAWPGLDLDRCRALAAELGVGFRVRPFSG